RSCSRWSRESVLSCLLHRMKRFTRSTLPWRSSRRRSLASPCLLGPSGFSVSEALLCTLRSWTLPASLTFLLRVSRQVGVWLVVFAAVFPAGVLQAPRVGR